MSLPEVFRILRGEHAKISRVLAVLESQIEAAKHEGRPDFEIVDAIAKYFGQYPDRYHHPKEELVLAKLKERVPDLVPELEVVEAEHKEIAERTTSFAESIAAIRSGAGDETEDFKNLARAFIDFERAHMIREDRHLMPLALEALTEADWQEIDAEISSVDDPLFGPEAEAPFNALRILIMGGR
ncbi:MAG: hemerythrin domain-containing protein [Alphaproteobacteria bacterium]|nr:hemerythrin domain-containing protein [Alphaproteobacteria bacterium]